jgi:hypothetical protein
MNRQRRFLIFALAALVTGGFLIVYGHNLFLPPERAEAGGNQGLTGAEGVVSEQQKVAPSPEPAPESASPPDSPPMEALYDPEALPEPVRRMRAEILHAARSGDLEALRPVLEMSELKPMVATKHVPDPIAHWQANSADDRGRDLLAAMLNVFESGFARVGEGKDEIYVWPYFAEADLTKLAPYQEVELYRLMPAEQAKAMRDSGKYTYWRAGIGPGGEWHYFLQ